MDLTKELLQKAKKTESAEALLALAKENGMEMTQEEADAYFAELHKTGELSDDELENVTGGGCGGKKPKRQRNPCAFCNTWKCKYDQSPNWKVIKSPFNGLDDQVCIVCGKTVDCFSCAYGKKEADGWYCYRGIWK